MSRFRAFLDDVSHDWRHWSKREKCIIAGAIIVIGCAILLLS